MSLSGVLDKSSPFAPGSVVTSGSVDNPLSQAVVVSRLNVNDEEVCGFLTDQPSVGPRMPNSSGGAWMCFQTSTSPALYSAPLWIGSPGTFPTTSVAATFQYGYNYTWVPGVAPSLAAYVAAPATPATPGVGLSNWGWLKAVGAPNVMTVSVPGASLLAGGYTSWYAKAAAGFAFPTVLTSKTYFANGAGTQLGWNTVNNINAQGFTMTSSNNSTGGSPPLDESVLFWFCLGGSAPVFGASIAQ
jgi:hypothetical protein